MKTTARHFAEFRRYHAAYMRRFGLLQWRVVYEHAKVDDAYAGTEWDFKGGIATVTLATDWGEEEPRVNTRELRRVAKHEAIHLLTAPLYWHALERHTTSGAMEATEHALVRALDNLIPD